MRIMAALAGKLAMKYTRTVSASRELMFPHGNLCIARLSQGRARSILATGAVIILLLSFLLPFLPLPVSANPAFVARAETFATSSAATDLTVDKPDGTANGDILFAFLMWRYATAPQTIDGVPAGWTLLGASNTGNIDEYALYYKIASGEGANYAWSLTGTSKFSIVCSAYTSGDFDPADPIDVVSNTAYRTVDDLAKAASMTTNHANCPLVFWGAFYSTGTASFTKPSVPTNEWVEDYDYWHTAADFGAEVCSMVWAGSGATGAMSATMTTSTDKKHAFAVALNPSGPVAPTVVTNAATSVSYLTATLGGNVTNDGGATITTRGFEWDTNSGAPYAYDWHEDGSFAAGAFSRGITGLCCNQTIYFRAYATNGVGTTYGNELNFTTTACTAPNMATYNATSVSYLTATLNGDMTIIDSTATLRGFEWGLSTGSYTWAWNETGDFGNGVFSRSIGGLSDGTTYYFRVLASICTEIGYGGELNFTTLAYTPPILTTVNATGISYTIATLNANITGIDGSNATKRGFDWGTSTGNYSWSWNETGSFGIGVFSYNLTSLPDGQTRYFRAFAINAEGTGYGGELNFTTTAYTPPILTTNNATAISYTGATLWGDVIDVDGINATERGFDWGYSSGAPYAFNWTESGNYTTGIFGYNATGLTVGTMVFFRAKAYNAGGWGYGGELNFTTLLPLPLAPTNFTATQTGVNQVTLTWTMGLYAVSTTIRARENDPPTSLTEGYEVFAGTGTSVNVTMTLGELSSYGFSAWSYNPTGYSVGYATTTIGGTMILMMILGFLALGLTVAMFATKNSMLGFPCGIFWAIFGGANYLASATTWDIYYLLFFAAMGMFIFTIFAAFALRHKDLSGPDADTETYIDEDGNKKRRRKSIINVETPRAQGSWGDIDRLGMNDTDDAGYVSTQTERVHNGMSRVHGRINNRRIQRRLDAGRIER